MTTIKLSGAVQVELAREFSGAEGISATVEGNTVRFDADDAADLEDVARDAERYWSRLGKRSKARAAETLMRKFGEIRAAESAALSMEARRSAR